MKASKEFAREQQVKNLARRILDAEIDAATITYTKTLINVSTVSITTLESRLAELKKGAAQWPTFETRKTVEVVSSARGHFTW